MKIVATLKETKKANLFLYALWLFLTWLAYSYVAPVLLPVFFPNVPAIIADPSLLQFVCFMYAARMVPRLLFSTLRIAKD